MGRPRKPTRMLELSGYSAKHPERRKEREGEPIVTEPLGSPPAYLDESERACWEELSGMAYRLTKTTGWPWRLRRGVTVGNQVPAD